MSTARFGLSDSVDHAVIDAVLAALETHDHVGGQRLVGPVGLPTLLQSPNNGALPGSTTFYYRYSFLDQYGFETAASGEVGITTPEIVTPPQPPELFSKSGGLLYQGLYYYFLSAVVNVTEQTQLSAPAVITVVPGQGSVQVNGPLVDQAGVDGYNVWRQGPGEAGPTRVGTFTIQQPGWLDDGTVVASSDPANLPPTNTLTNSTNAVTLALHPDDAATLAAGAASGRISRWRVYRSISSGAFTNRSLLANVGPDSTGVIPSLYVDNGGATPVQGAPSDIDRTLHPSVAVRSGGGGGDIENPTLMSPDHNLWTMDILPDGGPISIEGSWGWSYPLGEGPLMQAGDGSIWRLATENDGSFSTTRVQPVAGDRLYLVNDGPIILVTATVRYRLGVDPDGALIFIRVAGKHATLTFNDLGLLAFVPPVGWTIGKHGAGTATFVGTGTGGLEMRGDRPAMLYDWGDALNYTATVTMGAGVGNHTEFWAHTRAPAGSLASFDNRLILTLHQASGYRVAGVYSSPVGFETDVVGAYVTPAAGDVLTIKRTGIKLRVELRTSTGIVRRGFTVQIPDPLRAYTAGGVVQNIATSTAVVDDISFTP